ncbi:MAG: hypothetical protein JSV56_03945 [Methanomassiliicoccales archaeon]|nr:MAG: hypothetical protein JSV56_03945 [Methanomassiliicoccales archaeon]
MNQASTVKDKHIEKILIATSLHPMTAMNLSRIFGIPSAICHRKVNLLESLDLITCVERLMSEEDGITKVYSAKRDKVTVHQDDGRFVVRINVPLDLALQLSYGWRTLLA